MFSSYFTCMQSTHDLFKSLMIMRFAQQHYQKYTAISHCSDSCKVLYPVVGFKKHSHVIHSCLAKPAIIPFLLSSFYLSTGTV